MKRTSARLIKLLILAWVAAFVYGASAQEQSLVKDSEIRISRFVPLEYPEVALHGYVQGVVVVKVTLDDAGKVIKADAISGAKLLIPAALTNVERWKFEPNGLRTVVVVYNFRIPPGGCQSSSTPFMVQRPNLVTVIGCELSK